MEITLTESNSLKIISGNYTLVTNPVTKNNYNVGLFNNPTIKSKNNGHLIINSPGEFEIGNFYITSIGYEGNSESENNTTQQSQNNETNGTPVQQSLIDFEEQKTQYYIKTKVRERTKLLDLIEIKFYFQNKYPYQTTKGGVFTIVNDKDTRKDVWQTYLGKINKDGFEGEKAWWEVALEKRIPKKDKK